MSGGCIAEVVRVRLSRVVDGVGSDVVVAKVGGGGRGGGSEVGGELAIEARMLRYLGERSRLPVPRVIHEGAELLVMEHVETGRVVDRDACERHAAALLADLHGIEPDGALDEMPDELSDGGAAFGLGFDTVIGALDQPNGWMGDWVAFFRERRLLRFARDAAECGALPGGGLARIERLAAELDGLLELPKGVARRSSLIHGDAWSGNILLDGDRVVGMIDPAIYFADAEIELAFATLFGSLGSAFFERYAALRPEWAEAMPSFFARRRDVYNLYPLLVHARLFGGGYGEQVMGVVRRYGF